MAQDLELRDYLRTILRRKTLIFVVTLASSVVSGVWAWRQRPKYTAQSQVKVARRQTFADMRRVAFYQTQTKIQTYVHEIVGYRVLRRAAAQLATSTAKIEQMAQRMRAALVVEQEPGTDLINIRMTSYNNTEVVAVVNAVAKAFKEYHEETIMRGAQTMRRQIENWRDELLTQLASDERRLEEFREKNRLIDVESEGVNLVNRLSTLEESLSDLDVKLEEYKGRVKFLEAQVAEARKVGPSADVHVSPTRYLEMVKGKIFSLDLEKTGFLATGNYTRSHPQVRHAEALLDAARQARDVEVMSILDATANRFKTEIAGLEGRRDMLLKKREALNQRLTKLPALQQQVQEIIRRKNIAEELAVFLSRRYEEARIAALDAPEIAEIVSPARQAARLISNKVRVALAGVVLGFLLGVGLAFLAESLDTSIATIAAFEETFNLPVLAVVPFIQSDLREASAGRSESLLHTVRAWLGRFLAMARNWSSFIYGRQQLLHSPHGIELAPLYTPKSPVTEAYRTLRTNIEFYMNQTGAKVLMITSANTGEGKTVTTANLGLVMAQLGRRVLLVGADMRKPNLFAQFGIPKERGLSDVLLGELSWQDAVKGMADIAVGKMASEDVFLAPGLDNLSIITCGTVAPQPSEWLSLPSARQFFRDVAAEFDVVLVDVPPALPVPDAMIVGGMTDGAVLVYQVGQTAREAMRRGLQNLRNNGVNLLGFILNALRAEYASQSDFSAYTYYYYGGLVSDSEE
ncbi:MAG: polysaccharide biosynthesis tyrosine autokinase [Kiritimatiellaeota bacterium]|nr:polysaccharide biosynthesis tyrosine autokinase [Kiritimatiellota bacterium]